MASPVLVLALLFLALFNFFLWTRYPGTNTFDRNNNGNKDEEDYGQMLNRIEQDIGGLQNIERQLRIYNGRNDKSSDKPSDKSDNPNTSVGFEEMMQNAIRMSKEQIPLRKRTLKAMVKNDTYWLLYGSLASEVFCPQKIRIGAIGDGGKWMCNPWSIPNNCTIISLGLNNQVDFDISLQGLLNNRCEVYGFDSATQNAMTLNQYSRIRGKAMKAFVNVVTDKTKDKYTIEDLMIESKVTNVEILKIDVEGAEKTALIPFLKKFTVCQILIEMHGGANEHAKLLKELANENYRLFSYEINGWSMSACEYSLIHESCIDKYGGKRIAYYLNFDQI